jgi:hypothetical protein
VGVDKSRNDCEIRSLGIMDANTRIDVGPNGCNCIGSVVDVFFCSEVGGRPVAIYLQARCVVNVLSIDADVADDADDADGADGADDADDVGDLKDRFSPGCKSQKASASIQKYMRTAANCLFLPAHVLSNSFYLSFNMPARRHFFRSPSLIKQRQGTIYNCLSWQLP